MVPATSNKLADVIRSRAKLGDDFERELFQAFVYCEGNNHEADPAELESLFRSCDRTRLCAAGDEPSEFCNPMPVFRGVAGMKARHERGLSWTTLLPSACWFATRFNLPNPTIYAAQLQQMEVFAFVNKGSERELIGRPEAVYRLEISRTQVRKLASAYVSMCGED